jgi:hypothetical protein
LLFTEGVTKLARVFASRSLRRRSTFEFDALARCLGGWLYGDRERPTCQRLLPPRWKRRQSQQLVSLAERSYNESFSIFARSDVFSRGSCLAARHLTDGVGQSGEGHCNELERRAAIITVETLRHSFLHNIPEHRAIVAAWHAHRGVSAGEQ